MPLRSKAWAYSVNRKIGYARSDDTHAYEDTLAILWLALFTPANSAIRQAKILA